MVRHGVARMGWATHLSKRRWSPGICVLVRAVLTLVNELSSMQQLVLAFDAFWGELEIQPSQLVARRRDDDVLVCEGTNAITRRDKITRRALSSKVLHTVVEESAVFYNTPALSPVLFCENTCEIVL